MIRTTLLGVLSLITVVTLVADLAAAPDLASDVRAMFASGSWTRALAVLEKTPNAQSDPTLRELLAMAYLYSASDLDSHGHMEKARTLMRQTIEQGGKARFFVSLGRDKKKEANLLDSTPGELAVTTTYIEFQALDGRPQPPLRWEKQALTECALNSRYGKSSNSFHITVSKDRDKSEQNFRPWHFSADESNLICSLIGVQPPARR